MHCLFAFLYTFRLAISKHVHLATMAVIIKMAVDQNSLFRNYITGGNQSSFRFNFKVISICQLFP